MKNFCNQAKDINHYILVNTGIFHIDTFYPYYIILLMIFVSTGFPSRKIMLASELISDTFCIWKFPFALDYRSRAKLTLAKTWQKTELLLPHPGNPHLKAANQNCTSTAKNIDCFFYYLAKINRFVVLLRPLLIYSLWELNLITECSSHTLFCHVIKFQSELI